MSISKSTKKTTSQTAHSAHARSTKPKAGPSSRTKLVRRAARLAVPTAAVLGVGALGAGAYLMREELAEQMHGAMEHGLALTKNLTFPKLLAVAGLRRRRSFLSAALPELGVLAVGLVSGAALAYWLAPKAAEVASVPVAPVKGGSATASPLEPSTGALFQAS